MAHAVSTCASRGFKRSSAVAIGQYLYSALIALVVWTALVPFTLLQVLRGRATLRDLRERLGATSVPAAESTRIVVHAVSAGEAMAAGAFIRALAGQRPDWSVIVTCGNRDARAVALALQQRLPTVTAVIALPWDRAAASRRWLRTIQASALVVVEPEIWPNLYHACRALEIPLLLVNGRVRPRDVDRYRAARWFFADVLAVPAWIGVQTEVERDRFHAIGAPPERIEVAGSLKFDATLDPDQTAIWSHVNAAQQSGHALLVGGSTYRAEEDLLMRTLEDLRPGVPALRLILVPRHVSRADAIVARCRGRGLRVVKASAIESAPWDVLVVDRFGELSGLYALADIAVVGGTLSARGGHNVLEPARRGCAIIVGPHVQHIQHLVEGLEAADGIIRLADATLDGLRDAVGQLLACDVARQALGERARTYCARHRGAARRSVVAMIDRMPVFVDAQAFNARDPLRVPPETRPLGASEAAS